MKWTSRQGLIALFLFVILIQLYWHNAKMNRTHNRYLASIALESDYRRNIEEQIYRFIAHADAPLERINALKDLTNLDSFLEQTQQIFPDYKPPKRKEKIDSLEVRYQRTELWKYVLGIDDHFNYRQYIFFRPDTGQYANFNLFHFAYPKEPSNYSFIADGKEHKIDKFPFYTNHKPIKIIKKPFFGEKRVYKERLYDEK